MENYTKNKELGHFLKSRRQMISPVQVGIPDSKRRRASGLRREEVAWLSNVSISWYTRLEQGKEIQVSSQVLLSVAKTLHLNADETIYSLNLAGFSSGLYENIPLEKVSHMVQHVLDSFVTAPAIVLDIYWNIIAWNSISCSLFYDFEQLEPCDCNLLKLLFLNSDFKKLYQQPTWEMKAKITLANFRRSFIQTINDEQFLSLIEQLSILSPEFNTWWSDHNIASEHELTKTIVHPQLGELIFEHTSYPLSDKDNLKMYVNLPKKDSTTEKKITHFIS
ncbi:hypothetical protein ATZ33_03770 [Enterococcus silesiacus]|uniref:DNA-binding protein n=1 Tax=Enterococcus silesiacus TaxID=332949 RepID=A0A0S3K8F9_9ENTE|nr:helix-turn-helix transcriptional regulator [Enterococcus silesiacus]ALS00519.1 hypothetical protein ATZ33_03770 [Enterococcus silesiacus]OJG91240.1 DNA-binding protein [Enterococcus silesiacus]